MINIDDIKNRSALTLLTDYQGKNPYIRKLRWEYVQHNTKLTENQMKYIIDNHDKEPLKMDKVVRISPLLGEELQKQCDISFIPEKILIEYLLADTDKAFHIIGKLKKNQQESRMYWIPKTQIFDDIYFDEINVEVDFDKYKALDSLHREPYEHQKTGVKFLLSRNGCILADDMGLGKTYQAIVGALEAKAERILIVCPSSVKINWQREINNFTDDAVIVSGKKWKSSQFTIINYDILKNFHSLKERKKVDPDEDVVVEFNTQLVKGDFDLVIIDEAHYLKNPKSIRGKIMTDLCVKHNIAKVWLLSGTPITNRPMDYYNLLKLIKSPITDNWIFYARRYCDGKKFFKTLKTGVRKQIWLTNGASNLDELAQKTRNIILRRKKEEVLDMPEKTRTPVFHELDKAGRSEYNNLWEEYLEQRRLEGKTVNLQRDLTETILLRRFIAKQSIPHTIDLANSAIEQDQKVIIFTTFTDELLELQEYFGKECVVHYGKITARQKQFAIDKFQNDPNIKVFIGNVISAGVGINLTAANIVIFNSYDWVPGNNDQCEDRAYRIGQNNNVTVYYHLFMKTISTLMWKILYGKRNVIATIMNEHNCPEDIAIDIILKDEIDNGDDSDCVSD
jgi:SWI/SNF-related matrix-associated actin-dependent regulator 1 of chromatin subfamily A